MRSQSGSPTSCLSRLGHRGIVMRVIALVEGRIRGVPRPVTQTRLSAIEAINLAKQAARDHWLRDSLGVATADRLDNGLVVWTVETGGVGSFQRFTIDDASGAILDRGEHVGR